MARLLVNGWQSPVSSRRRSIGNVGIPQEFPRGVRRVGSRYFGFPCFPLLGIPTLACRLGLARNFASDDIGVSQYLSVETEASPIPAKTCRLQVMRSSTLQQLLSVVAVT